MKTMFTLILAALSLSALGCSNDSGPAGGSGLIEATESVVSAETNGRVLALRFNEGSHLTTGDTLLAIDPSRIELDLAAARAGREVLTAQVKTARTQIDQARIAEEFIQSELDRAYNLLKTNTGSERQFDQANFEHSKASVALDAAKAQVATLQAQIKQADAEINRLARRLEDCFPLAPVTGTVVETFVEPGELLGPGQAVARIARLDSVWVKVYLAAADFAEVRLGDLAEVSTETDETSFEGRVIWTSSEAEFTPKNVQTEQARADLVYAVKIQMANPDRKLKIGMPVFVTLGE